MVSAVAAEVVTTNQSWRWKELLEETGSFNYYHLPEFHRLAEIRGSGEAVMPVFREKEYMMVFPLMIRNIEMPADITAGKDYRDAVSAPGMIGPLVSAQSVPEDARLELMQQFQEFLVEKRIITVYSRLNFFFNQMELLRGFGEIRDMSLEVSVDLTKPAERQFKDYIKGHRQNINKLKKMGFIVTEVGLDHLDGFLEIYYDTMDKVNAQQVYYYDRSYFEFLLNEMGDNMHLFVCKDGEATAAAGIFCMCNGIIHYLYAGTTRDYNRLSPSKLIIHEVSEWGRRVGAHTLHLGGSSGGPDDTLHLFKMGFGGQEHVYSVWRYVANQDIYDYLCREVCRCMDTEPDDSYFPMYRNPNLQMNAAVGG